MNRRDFLKMGALLPTLKIGDLGKDAPQVREFEVWDTVKIIARDAEFFNFNEEGTVYEVSGNKKHKKLYYVRKPLETKGWKAEWFEAQDLNLIKPNYRR